MVCAHCGTLNQDGGGQCAHCGCPLTASAEEMCGNHPMRRAIARCGRCDAALCEDCVVHVRGNPYCATHARALITTPAEGYLAETPVLDPRTKPVATFAQRVTAALIDAAIIGTWWMILYMGVWSVVGSPPSMPDAGGWRPVFWAVGILGSLAYLFYEYVTGGSTIGMAVTDLIALRPDGTLMGPGTAALRTILVTLGTLLGGVTFWAILWNPDRRALHDRWTRTVVVYESGTVPEGMPVEQ